MPRHLRCPKGHQWEPGNPPARPETFLPTCPVCGNLPATQEQGAPAVNQPTGQYTPPGYVGLVATSGGGSGSSALGGRVGDGAPAGQRPPSRAGHLLAVAGYEVLGELGRGGMGVVYKAKQRGLERIVALKMIIGGVHADDTEIQRFLQEARAVARLHHANIIQVYDVGEQDGQPYFSMEFVDGGSLANRLNGTPVPASQAAELVMLVARAVHHAHQKNIVHRDLKPANILLKPINTASDQSNAVVSCSLPFFRNSNLPVIPKITDFGLAKVVEHEAHLTQSAAVVGTPSYMAPEQTLGDRAAIGPAIDVYALGAILYELVTGRPPFNAENPVETMLQVRHTEPVSPRRLNPKLPVDLETVCLKCLEKVPGKRYETAEHLANDLARFLVGDPVYARPIPLWRHGIRLARRNPTMTAIFFGLLFTAVLLTTAGFWAQEREQAQQATQLVEQLTTADFAQVPRVIDSLKPFRGLVRPELRRIADAAAESPGRRLRARLALLPDDPSQFKPVFDSLLECAPGELSVLCERLQPYSHDLARTLPGVLRDQRQKHQPRFHAGLALSRCAPGALAWTPEDLNFLADQLTRASRDYQRDFRTLLRPIGGNLVGPLRSTFLASPKTSERLAAADALADFARDRSTLLAELACDASLEQYEVVRAALVISPNLEEAGAVLQDVIHTGPTPKMSEDERVRIGQRRAIAAIALLHMGQPQPVRDFFRAGPDPEAVTQFLARVRDWHVPLATLIDELQRPQAAPDARVAHLLALGEFPWHELPDTQRAEVLDAVAQWFRSDSSAAVHAAAGWLLRRWNFAARANRIELEVSQPPASPPPADRQWFVERLGPESTITFVVVEPGEFQMGSPAGEKYRQRNERQHPVRISRRYAIADRELTRGQFEAFLRATGKLVPDISESSPTPEHPVVKVTWDEAIQYCRWLTGKGGLPDADQCYPAAKDPDRFEPARSGYRLPTEAEWEYACRAGTITTYSFGSDRKLLDRYGLHMDEKSEVVGKLRPNPWGLFDMHGNVWEWCQDRYQDELPDGQTDPLAKPSAEDSPEWRVPRALRGGGWDRSPWHCRSAYRHSPTWNYRGSYMGFRVVRTLAK